MTLEVEGLWTVEFSTGLNVASGVAVLTQGRVMGGDSTYYYDGTYRLNNTSFEADVSVTHYSGPLNNIFGPVRFVSLKIKGSVGEDLIMAQGFNPSQPSQFASFKLRRVQSL